MVLGFGSKKKKGPSEPVFIRVSPSLPELTRQRIPWPEDLIDPNVVDEVEYYEPLASEGHGVASKVSFQSNRGPAISFHRPFRAGADSPVSIAGSKAPSVPPSAFSGVGARSRAGSHPLSHSRSNRRGKNPSTFNVMVAGAKHTGKSSLLRLLLDTSTISPTNAQEQLLSLSTFRSSSVRPTSAINATCVEILYPPLGHMPTMDDRVLLTCIDTPGLNFAEGKEFALDRAVSSIVKYVDLQFAETLGEESKVIRTSKGDQHVHLCIYLIDPDSVMTPSARRAKSRLSAAIHGYPLSHTDMQEPSEYDSDSEEDPIADSAATSNGHGHHGDEHETTESAGTPLTPVSSDHATPRNTGASTSPQRVNKVQDQNEQLQTPEQSQASSQQPNRLSMSPAEIRVISRLAKRVNVLPVVARADTLTDGRLERIKRAIRRDLQAVSIAGDEDIENISIFALWDAEPGSLFGRQESENKNADGSSNGHVTMDDVDDERQSRPVIKLRNRAPSRSPARSRSRKQLRSAAGVEYDTPELSAQAGYPVSALPPSHGRGDESWLKSPQSRRTSVETTAASDLPYLNTTFSRAELRARIPFAVIAPERERDREKGVSTATSSQRGHVHGAQAPDGKNKFIRRFRWGTVDVLDPQHCDFAALRTAVLGSYMRALKVATKDVLYERFRTEKLLVRRATRNISDEDRKRILQDLKL